MFYYNDTERSFIAAAAAKLAMGMDGELQNRMNECPRASRYLGELRDFFENQGVFSRNVFNCEDMCLEIIKGAMMLVVEDCTNDLYYDCLTDDGGLFLKLRQRYIERHGCAPVKLIKICAPTFDCDASHINSVNAYAALHRSVQPAAERCVRALYEEVVCADAFREVCREVGVSDSVAEEFLGELYAESAGAGIILPPELFFAAGRFARVAGEEIAVACRRSVERYAHNDRELKEFLSRRRVFDGLKTA